MPLRTACVVATAGALTAVALAAPAAKDPMRLALQRSDFPAGATVSLARDPASGVRAFGVRGLKAATYTVTAPTGRSVSVGGVGDVPTSWRIDGSVFVAPDTGGARKLFRLGKRARVGFFPDIASNPQPTSLRSFGDEQLAFTTRPSRYVSTIGVVFVRRNAVVWQIRVTSAPLQWRPSKAQVLAELEKYAAKQRGRVGAG